MTNCLDVVSEKLFPLYSNNVNKEIHKLLRGQEVFYEYLIIHDEEKKTKTL